jgi:hypothetical protein
MHMVKVKVRTIWYGGSQKDDDRMEKQKSVLKLVKKHVWETIVAQDL